MKVVLVVFCFFFLAQGRRLTEYLIDGGKGEPSEIRECHGMTCPVGTVGCRKTSKTSNDTLIIITTLNCEDIQGKVLNSKTKTSVNNYQGTHVSSFSFTGQYSTNAGNFAKPSIFQSTNFNKDRGAGMVETFD